MFESKDAKRLHPVEVAQVLNHLPADSTLNVFVSFSYESQLQIFPHLDYLVQKKLISTLPQENASEILNAISLDDRVSLFSTLKDLERTQYLEYLDEDNKKSTLDILGYPKQSVARLINTDFATLKKDMSLAEAIEYLRKNLFLL